MADPFLAETRIMTYAFAPRGWAMCNGQLLPINQNQTLFALLGTTFGGDGRVNFGLPDLRGRIPIHVGNGHTLGEKGGEQAHTLTITELPKHTHGLKSMSQAVTTNIPVANTSVLANTAPNQVYNNSSNTLTALNTGSITNIGGSQAHLNMQPFLTLNFCIALAGVFPSQT